MESYFNLVPCVSWKDWFISQIPLGEKEPSIFQLPKPPPFPSPERLNPTIENARELSDFLNQYFYEPTHPYSLILPPRKLLEYLQKGVIALGIRKGKRLIGCIFEFPMGYYKGASCGLITWLCVHPQWRKQGIANQLYYGITFSKGVAQIKWFRNDSLQSPLPPIYSEKKMLRTIRAMPSCNVRQEMWTNATRNLFQSLWKGDIFIKSETSFLQLWSFRKSSSLLLALVQPTFDMEKKTLKQVCEIVAVVSDGFKDLYEETQAFEQLVDSLPWQLCEAPETVPHIESFWTIVGMTSLSVVGLDPGRPFRRTVLSLSAF